MRYRGVVVYILFFFIRVVLSGVDYSEDPPSRGNSDIVITGYKTIRINWNSISGDRTSYYNLNFTSDGLKIENETMLEVEGWASDVLIRGNFVDIPGMDRRVEISFIGRDFKISMGDVSASLVPENEFGLKNLAIRGISGNFKKGKWEIGTFVSQSRARWAHESFRPNSTTNRFRLRNAPVVADSVKVRLNGQLLNYGRDYWVDEELGEVILRATLMPLPENSVIEIEYQYLNDLFGVFPTQLQGFSLRAVVKGFKTNLALFRTVTKSEDSGVSILGANSMESGSLKNFMFGVAKSFKNFTFNLSTSLGGVNELKPAFDLKEALKLGNWEFSHRFNLVATGWKGFEEREPVVFNELGLKYAIDNVSLNLFGKAGYGYNATTQDKRILDEGSFSLSLGNLKRDGFLIGVSGKYNYSLSQRKELKFYSEKLLGNRFTIKPYFEVVSVATEEGASRSRLFGDYIADKKGGLEFRYSSGIYGFTALFEKSMIDDRRLARVNGNYRKKGLSVNVNMALVNEDKETKLGEFRTQYRKDRHYFSALARYSEVDDTANTADSLARVSYRYRYNFFTFDLLGSYERTKSVLDKRLFRGKSGLTFNLKKIGRFGVSYNLEKDFQAGWDKKIYEAFYKKEIFGFNLKLKGRFGDEDEKEGEIEREVGWVKLGVFGGRRQEDGKNDMVYWYGLRGVGFGKMHLYGEIKVTNSDDELYDGLLTANLKVSLKSTQRFSVDLKLDYQKKKDDYSASGFGLEVTHNF